MISVPPEQYWLQPTSLVLEVALNAEDLPGAAASPARVGSWSTSRPSAVRARAARRLLFQDNSDESSIL
jgi:hypothetical protein